MSLFSVHSYDYFLYYANILAFIAMMIVVAGLLVMNIFIKERSFWPQVFQTEKE